MSKEITGSIGQNDTPPGYMPRGHNFEALPFGTVEAPDVTGGMINRIPRAQENSNQSRDLKNARIRDGWRGRRPGTQVFGGTKPDSEPILALITYVTESADVSIVRITASGLSVSNAGVSGWTAFTVTDADGDPATFPASARFDTAQFFDKLYLADGVNPIWEVDFSAQTCQQIDGAPKAQFIATFADRIVAGNVGLTVGGIRQSTIVWSGNSNPNVWDPAEDLTSGQTDLALEDTGDRITGLWRVGETLVILRRTSIWTATRQPFSQAPLRFTSIWSKSGCDMPYTAQSVPGGIVYADQRTREVYFFSLSSAPQPMGVQVNREMLADLTRLSFAQGAYDFFEKEYHLGIIPDGETLITKVWVLAMEYTGWSYDDGPTASTISVVSLPAGGVAIDDLVGTIDAQTGTIDDYGGGGQVTPTLFKGTNTGEVIQQTYDADNDWDSTAFEYLAASANLGSPMNRRTLKDLSIRADVPASGNVVLEFSNDESTWSPSQTGAYTGAATRQNVRMPKTQLTGDDLYWRSRTTIPGYREYTWFVRLLQKNRHR